MPDHKQNSATQPLPRSVSTLNPNQPMKRKKMFASDIAMQTERALEESPVPMIAALNTMLAFAEERHRLEHTDRLIG